MIFGFFAVPPLYQHRVLFWGILGALVLRGVLIRLGAKLVAEFHWILYVFGAFLIVTAVKMLVLKTDHTDPNHNIVVRLTRRIFPITERFHGEHFIVRAGATQSHEAAVPGDTILADVGSAKLHVADLLVACMLFSYTFIHTTGRKVRHFFITVPLLCPPT